jgi:hypothetical protein
MSKAEKSRAQAEAIVAGKFERRFEDEVSRQLDGQVGDLSGYFLDYHVKPLAAFGVVPEITSSSSEHGVEMKFRNFLGELRGADTPHPPVKNHDFCVIAHETAFTILGGGYLAGTVWQDVDFASVLKELTGDVPRDARAGTNTRRWSVRFAQDHALTCKLLEGNVIDLTIRLAEYSVDGRRYEDPCEVHLQYHMQPTGWGPEFNRIGDIRHTYERADADATERDYLEFKIRAFWREQIYFDGIVPPAGGAWDHFRQLRVGDLRIENGWFVFGYDLPPE